MVLEQYNHTFIGVLIVNYHTFIKNDEVLLSFNSEDKYGYRLKSVLYKLLGMIFKIDNLRGGRKNKNHKIMALCLKQSLYSLIFRIRDCLF